jgi:OOP family OmpA-OmpF porin
MAIIECDPDLVRSPCRPLRRRRGAAAPRRRPRRRRLPRRPRKVQKITLASKALFDFDKAVLKPEGKAAIDTEIIAKLRDCAEARARARHRPHRIGSARRRTTRSCPSAAPMQFAITSCRRASRETRSRRSGMGKTQPVPGVVCNMKAMKELIACLAPNRRVEVEVKGEAVKR